LSPNYSFRKRYLFQAQLFLTRHRQGRRPSLRLDQRAPVFWGKATVKNQLTGREKEEN